MCVRVCMWMCIIMIFLSFVVISLFLYEVFIYAFIYSIIYLLSSHLSVIIAVFDFNFLRLVLMLSVSRAWSLYCSVTALLYLFPHYHHHHHHCRHDHHHHVCSFCDEYFAGLLAFWTISFSAFWEQLYIYKRNAAAIDCFFLFESIK